MTAQKILYIASSFVAGFALMTIELISSRIMAPIIGSSVYTWTSVIGITLLGLSLGSFVGGKIADRYQKNIVISLAFIFSAVFTALIPLLESTAKNFISLSDSIIILNLLISTFLFLIPAFFLGTIQPLILKKYSISIESLGEKYGNLSAIWSLGSILGVFLTGFYFISFIGSKNTLLSMSVILTILGSIYLYKQIPKLYFLIIILILIFLISGIKFYNPSKIVGLIYEKETNYFNVRVVDGEYNKSPTRYLFLDAESHSIEPKNGPTGYTSMCPVFSIINDNIKDIQFLGAGSYSMPKDCKKVFQNSNILVSEIDAKIKDVAEKYFALNSNEIKTVIGDSRLLLQKDPNKYDLIFGDVYNSFISVPGHLLTTEFNTLIKKHLTDNGIYAVNFISSLSGEKSELFSTVLNTLKLEFPNYYIFAFGNKPEATQNIVIVALNGPKTIPDNELYSRIINDSIRPELINNFITDEMVSKLNLMNTNIILTDDFTPTEKLMTSTIYDYFLAHFNFLKKISFY
ncbi:MAG: fused MFS/spermidine synthase [Minisyncoccia bacterium]